MRIPAGALLSAVAAAFFSADPLAEQYADIARFPYICTYTPHVDNHVCGRSQGEAIDCEDSDLYAGPWARCVYRRSPPLCIASTYIFNAL